MYANAFFQRENAENDSSYLQHVREEYTPTEDDGRTYIKAVSSRASGQWRAMSDAEKAVCTNFLLVINGKLTISFGAGRNIMTQLKLTLLLGARSVRQRVNPSSNG